MASSSTTCEEYIDSKESQTVPFLRENFQTDIGDANNSIVNDAHTNETYSEDIESNTRLNATIAVPLYIAGNASEFNNNKLEDDGNYFKEHIKLYNATRQVRESIV